METPDKNSEPLSDKKKLVHSLVFPFLFVIVLWIIKLFEYEFGWNLYYLGIYPRSIKGITGIITSPFIHGNFEHLFNNSTSLFILSVAIFYFYRPVQYKVFFLVYIISGIWVWFGARSAYHIGASGIVYGLASFIFFSGVIRNDVRLMAISLTVVFLYGSMVWGIFPIKREISWESHMWGSVAGLLIALYYRKAGPQRVKFSWEFEPEEGDKNLIQDENKNEKENSSGEKRSENLEIEDTDN